MRPPTKPEVPPAAAGDDVGDEDVVSKRRFLRGSFRVDGRRARADLATEREASMAGRRNSSLERSWVFGSVGKCSMAYLGAADGSKSAASYDDRNGEHNNSGQ